MKQLGDDVHINSVRKDDAHIMLLTRMQPSSNACYAN